MGLQKIFLEKLYNTKAISFECYQEGLKPHDKIMQPTQTLHCFLYTENSMQTFNQNDQIETN